eukprot:COSAG06_NODE_38777_length_419_cov_109.471875_2_plen_48_part_01
MRNKWQQKEDVCVSMRAPVPHDVDDRRPAVETMVVLHNAVLQVIVMLR